MRCGALPIVCIALAIAFACGTDKSTEPAPPRLTSFTLPCILRTVRADIRRKGEMSEQRRQ